MALIFGLLTVFAGGSVMLDLFGMREKEEMKHGKIPKPQLVEMNGKMVGYYAIVTNEMCVKCHGDKKADIEPATYKKIKALYPSDKGTGYAANELRGMWVVEMNKE